MSPTPRTTEVELRGSLILDQMQPQFAAVISVKSDGYFPVPGESAYWLEVRPGSPVNRLLDVALKTCDVKPGALITERTYGLLEVHGPDQHQVREAEERILKAAGVARDEQQAPKVLTSEVVRKIDAHQASLLNHVRDGMLILADDTLYTLEVTPAVWALLAANEAEKAAPIRIVGLENHGAVGRVRLAGTDAAIDSAVQAVERALEGIEGR
ncbi:MAG: hypothetical protein ACYSWX_10945 [Planctomycetota bacterium]|jgi:hypothetical protein